MRRALAVHAAYAAIVLIAAGASTSAEAQRLEPSRPRTLIVGPAASPAQAERVDGTRRGFVATLPEGTLHVLWRRSVGPSIEHGPIVTAEGNILVFGGRGDLIELAPNGVEKRKLGVGVGPLGPGAVLADGTVVTMTTAGEAVGIELAGDIARARFRTRIGDRGMLVKVAPLPLDDGGVVVANGVRGPVASPFVSEIATLDVDGHIRARATVPAAIAWPLIATRAGVAAIAADGTVFIWGPPGRSEGPVRVGSFGGTLEGGAASLGQNELVAVVDSKRVVALDLSTGEARVLLTSTAPSSGVLLGPPSVGSGTVYVLESSATAGRVLAIDVGGDAAGAVSALTISTTAASFGPDGGVTPAVVPVHTATLVDTAGRIAFAGPDGHVGVVSRSGMTDLGEVICSRGAPPLSGPGLTPVLTTRPSAGFAGIAPLGAGTFLVACEGGALLEISGD